jgi:hypothetical protein
MKESTIQTVNEGKQKVRSPQSNALFLCELNETPIQVVRHLSLKHKTGDKEEHTNCYPYKDRDNPHKSGVTMIQLFFKVEVKFCMEQYDNEYTYNPKQLYFFISFFHPALLAFNVLIGQRGEESERLFFDMFVQ